MGATVGRKPGVQNVSKEAAQPQVLELLAQGATVIDAMKAVAGVPVTTTAPVNDFTESLRVAAGLK